MSFLKKVFVLAPREYMFRLSTMSLGRVYVSLMVTFGMPYWFIAVLYGVFKYGIGTVSVKGLIWSLIVVPVETLPALIAFYMSRPAPKKKAENVKGN